MIFYLALLFFMTDLEFNILVGIAYIFLTIRCITLPKKSLAVTGYF